MGLRVVIPVAGMGTRLRPHTHTLPKVLVPVAGMPMLGHILTELRQYDVEEVTLIIGHLGEKVRDYVSKAFDFKFRFIVQDEIKGLGHAIWLSAPGYRESDGPLLVILGDTLFEADFGSILGSKENWIGVKEVEDPRRFGVVVLNAEGRITKMVEKPAHPPTNLAIVGIYYFNRATLLYQCLDEIVEGKVLTAGEIQLTDALDLMLRRGAEMKPFKIDAWHDCGKPETLLDTNRLLLARYDAKKSLPSHEHWPNCVIHSPVAIDPKVGELKDSVIGPNVTIGAGARITNAIIRDSIISTHAKVSGVLIEHSLIGDYAEVEGKFNRFDIGDASKVRLG